jgi:hypothetical protein
VPQQRPLIVFAWLQSGTGIASVPLQGIVDRVQGQVQQQRLKRALFQSRDKPVDVQVGFTVFLDVPQEIRSRLWLVLTQEPALAVPFQVLPWQT